MRTRPSLREVLLIARTVEAVLCRSRLRCLQERKVVLAMQGDGENLRVAFEDVSGAVSLVNVEIDYRCSLDPLITTQGENRDRDVVEYAEARPFCAKGMVGASCQIAAESRGERFVRRCQRASY